MSLDFTESSITDAVQRTFDGTKDARAKQVFVALVQHLHDFAREVRLTGEEWFTPDKPRTEITSDRQHPPAPWKERSQTSGSG